MYSGLSKLCPSLQCLLDLAIMYDTLAELLILSESLQNQETTVIYADKLIRSIRFFEAMKAKPGTKTLKVPSKKDTLPQSKVVFHSHRILKFQPSVISS